MGEYEDDNAFLESLDVSGPVEFKSGGDAGAVDVLRSGAAGIPLPPEVWPVPPNDPLARPLPRRATRMSAGKRAAR